MKFIIKLVLYFFFFPFYLVISFLARYSEKRSSQKLFDEFDQRDNSSSINNKNAFNGDAEHLVNEIDYESNSVDDEIEQVIDVEYFLEELELDLDNESFASINLTKIAQKKRSRWTPEDEAKWQTENQRETEHYESHVLTREYFKEKDIAPISWDFFFGTDVWDIPSQAIYELIEKEKEGKLIIPENTEDRKRLRQNLEKEIFEYEQARFAELPMIQRWGRTSEAFMKRISPFLK